MRQSEAIQYLRRFMLALQKYRSNVALDLPDVSDEFLAETWPWIFGDKCPLLQLDKVIGAVAKGKELNPSDYYNFMVILYRFTPEVLAIMNIMDVKNPMPEEQPPINILANGWKEEEE